jgi:hypothetical protein
MLIAVVLLFLICQLPTAITLLYSIFHDIEQNTNLGVLIRALGNLFNFLMAINAAGNFVLYCLLSQKYRRTFLQTFCPCLKGRVQKFQSAYYTQNSVIDSSVKKSMKNISNNRTSSRRMVSYVTSQNNDNSDFNVVENTKLNGIVVNKNLDKW